ncbi:MAG: hypothetical protein NZ738_07165 [Oceanospirillaceae bacterium]|nr:hypothetical protein [Oceanospirillaceae bacterium]
MALFGWFLPLVSPATIGLVSLRKDSSEGLIVTLWAILPWLAFYLASDVSPLVVLVPLAALVVIAVVANVLRSTGSWQWTLVATGLASALAAISFSFIANADVDLAVVELAEFFAEISAQAGISGELNFAPDRTFVLGLLAWLIGSAAVCGLFVSRWWQALLFNPGGFQEEFHGFRLDQPVAIILIAFVIAGVGLPLEYRPWLELMSLPLLISGVALVHSSVKLMGLGAHWLGLMYFGLFFIGPTGTVLVGLGLVDSILNLRSRLAAFKNRNS